MIFKKIFGLMLIILVFPALSLAGMNDRFSDIDLTEDETIDLPEITAPSGNPIANRGWIYVKDSGGTSNLYFEADDGTVTDLLAAGSVNWSDIGDPTADTTITFADNEITIFSLADTNEDMFTVQGIGAFGDVSVMKVESKTGNPTDGTVFEVVSHDTDVDALLVTANSVNVIQVNGAGTLSITGNTDITGSLSTTGSFYQTAIAAAASGNINLTIDAAGTGTITIGGTSTGKIVTDNLVELDGHVDIGDSAADTLTITSIVDGALTLDDNSGASPSFIMKDATNETAIFSKVDSGYLTITTAAADGVGVLTGNLTVGNGSPGTAAMDGEDFYCEGESEFDGPMQLDGAVTAASTLDVAGITSLAENLVMTAGADEYLQIDANTTANTGTAGVLDIDVQSATNTHKGASMTYQLEDGATLAYGWYTDVDDDTSGAEVIELYHAVNSAGTNATTKGFNIANTIDQGFVATNGAAAVALVVDATTTASTSTTGAIIDAAFRTATTAAQGINLDFESDVAGGAGEVVEGIHIQLDDDANSADDELIGIEFDTDGNGTGLQHAMVVRDNAGWDAGLYLEGGYLRVGTGGTPDQALGDGDNGYFEGTLEVDGNLYLDGNIIGDGATELVGVRHDVVDCGAGTPYTVTAAMSGTVFVNSQACEFDLPADPTGLEFTFVVHNASNLDIDPNGTDRFPSPITDTNGDYLRSSTVSDSITIVGFDASTWYLKATYPAATDWVEE